MIVRLRSFIYTYINTYTSAYAYICGVLIYAAPYSILHSLSQQWEQYAHLLQDG